MDELQFSYLGQEEHEEEHDDFHDDDEENIQNGRRYRGKDLDWRLQTTFENVEEYKNSNIFQDLKENFTLRKRRELHHGDVENFICRFSRKVGYTKCSREIKVVFPSDTVEVQIYEYKNHVHEESSQKSSKVYRWSALANSIIATGIKNGAKPKVILRNLRDQDAFGQGEEPSLNCLYNKVASMKKVLKLMSENYTLNWQTFTEHLQLMFRDLYQEGRYTDVTLVSDDQTQFKAHKIVLSACSPLFKKIIDGNPSQHPLIYLRGIRGYEIESILQFMYLGEARFYHERMGEFIKAAQDLEVTGISGFGERKSGEEETAEEDVTDDNVEETLENETGNQEKTKSRPIDDDAAFKVKEENILSTEIGEKVNKETENHEIETKPRPSQPRTQISNCLCSECGAVFNSKKNMLRHFRSIHECVKYPCIQCDYQATQPSGLRRHIQSKHEDVKYPCNQCDYQATEQGSLAAHISAKHSDTVLKCDSCDYQTKWRTNYYKHKRTHITMN